MTSLALKMGNEGEGGWSLEFDELANKKMQGLFKDDIFRQLLWYFWDGSQRD